MSLLVAVIVVVVVGIAAGGNMMHVTHECNYYRDLYEREGELE